MRVLSIDVGILMSQQNPDKLPQPINIVVEVEGRLAKKRKKKRKEERVVVVGLI